MMKTIWSLRAALVATALFFAPAAALAQQYEPVEGKVRENIPALPFVAGAYGFIWLAVFVYVAMVARRLLRVQNEIDDLRRRVDRG